jgi:virulence factor
LETLIQSESTAAGFSLAGLQKRYSPIYNALKDKVEKPYSYNLSYKTGSYPDGDILSELFIHPLDLAIHLFGPCTLSSVLATGNPKKGSLSLFIHLKHGDVIGQLELSTNYTWSRASESICVNTSAGCYTATNSESLTFEDRKGSILNVPMEKIFGHQPSTTSIVHRNGFLPTWENNPLYTAGFFDEISEFVSLCEGRAGKNQSALSQLKETYALIEAVRGSISHV